MGQRLNLEIHDDKNGGLQANAYYHWSGYSESAIELAQETIEALEKSEQTNPLFRAIEALEETGAGLTDDERSQAEVKLNGYEPKECNGRNAGLIAVTPKGMYGTRVQEEGRVEIHINGYRGNYIKYDVFWNHSPREHKEDHEEETSDIKLIDFDFEQVPFDKIGELKELVENNDTVKIERIITFIKTFIK